MNIPMLLKPWIIAGLVGVFVSACATPEAEFMEQDGAPTEEQINEQLQQEALLEEGSSADASGLGDSSTGNAIPFTDEDSMSAIEKLEQTDGVLANRVIYFEFDSAKLSDESLAALEEHGNFIASNGEVSVRLEGHSDERGSREYNIALADRRAQSVRRVLLFQGSSTDQIDTVSYGEEKPEAAGHSEEAWSRNRRVELIYQVN